MAITLTSFMIPKNNNTYYLLEDSFLKGGYRIVANINARNAIDASCRKSGMLVKTLADQKTWSLNSDLVAWTEEVNNIILAVVLQTSTDHKHSLGITAFDLLALIAGTVSSLTLNSSTTVSQAYGSHAHIVHVTLVQDALVFVVDGSHAHTTKIIGDGTSSGPVIQETLITKFPWES